jgi:hypothetical protein
MLSYRDITFANNRLIKLKAGAKTPYLKVTGGRDS